MPSTYSDRGKPNSDDKNEVGSMVLCQGKGVVTAEYDQKCHGQNGCDDGVIFDGGHAESVKAMQRMCKENA